MRVVRDYRKGDWVEILDGPLRGRRGRLCQVKMMSSAIWWTVKFPGQKTTLGFPSDWLKKLTALDRLADI